MMLTVLTRSTFSGERTGGRTGPGAPDPAQPASLEANSHRPEVQALIREAIRRRTLRVRPFPGHPDRVQIIPTPLGGRPDRATPGTEPRAGKPA